MAIINLSIFLAPLSQTNVFVYFDMHKRVDVASYDLPSAVELTTIVHIVINYGDVMYS